MIEFYTAATPNGHKISILLEETGLDYSMHELDFVEKQHQTPQFLAINPNGRIPAIVDTGNDDFAVFESGAILIYLAELSGQFLSNDTKTRSLALQWLQFQMSGIGPMMGQCFVFKHYFPEKLPAVIDRYSTESRRLFSVLDQQLQRFEFLAGEYSIADIATWPWVRLHEKLQIDISTYPALERWLKQIGQRPAVRRGIEIPVMMSDEDRVKVASSILTKEEKI